MRRTICIVTGTRAEYGPLYWLMKEIQEDVVISPLIAAKATFAIKSGLKLFRIFGPPFSSNSIKSDS